MVVALGLWNVIMAVVLIVGIGFVTLVVALLMFLDSNNNLIPNRRKSRLDKAREETEVRRERLKQTMLSAQENYLNDQIISGANPFQLEERARTPEHQTIHSTSQPRPLRGTGSPQGIRGGDG